MKKLLGLVGATAGGWLGWIIGEPGGFFLAFMLSIVGTGIGMYYGYRLASRYS
ncbi:MAG TPA: hypothetical protein VF039_08710 [Longimicrobiales bacterium]